MVGLVTACSDFGTQNVSPNAATTPVTSALLTEAIVGVPPTTSTGALLEGVAGRLTVLAFEPRLFIQYWSQTQYPENSLYSTTYASWDRYYGVTLQDLQTIINYNTDPATKLYVSQFGSNANQIGYFPHSEGVYVLGHYRPLGRRTVFQCAEAGRLR